MAQQYCLNPDRANRAHRADGHPMRALRALRALSALSALLALPVQAQETATIRGQVLDQETGDSLPGAVVRVKGQEPITVGPTGRFEVAGVRPGSVEISITAIGYSTGVFKFNLQPNQVVTRNFGLEFTGARLPEMLVTARAMRLAPRYIDFERRRDRGLGAYFRWDDIKQRGFGTVGDALRTVRGVRIKCNQQTYECFAEMVRSPGCPPQWWVDGVMVGSFHENTPIRDIYGIEVYRGAGELPADFGGSTGMCGAIVVWTKSKPYQ